jgi:hypothetical protein
MDVSLAVRSLPTCRAGAAEVASIDVCGVMRICALSTVETRVTCGASRPDEGSTFVDIRLTMNSVKAWWTLANELIGFYLTRPNAMCCSLEDSAMVVMGHAFAVRTRVQQICERSVRCDTNDSFHLNICAVLVLKIYVR